MTPRERARAPARRAIHGSKLGAAGAGVAAVVVLAVASRASLARAGDPPSRAPSSAPSAAPPASAAPAASSPEGAEGSRDAEGGAAGWTPEAIAPPGATVAAGPAEAKPPETSAASGADPCRSRAQCRARGECHLEGDACVAKAPADCQSSEACRSVLSRCAFDAEARQCVPGPRPVEPPTEAAPPVPWTPAPESGTLAAGIVLAVLASASFVVAPACRAIAEGSVEGECLGVSVGSGLALAAVGVPLIVIASVSGGDAPPAAPGATRPGAASPPHATRPRAPAATTSLDVAPSPSGLFVSIRRTFF
jgi:hypothetical protein